MVKTLPTTNERNDSDELARFRDAWKAEVQQRKEQHDHIQGTQPPASRQPIFSENRELHEQTLSPNVGSSIPLGYSATHLLTTVQPEPTARVTEPIDFTKNQASAIEVYSRAIAAEQAGDLDGALRLYRSAFRLYDDIDRLWRKAESQAQAKPVAAGPSKKVNAKQVEGIIHDMGSLHFQPSTAPARRETAVHEQLVQNAHHTSTVTGILEDVVSAFPASLSFEPEEEKKKVALKKLPDELLVQVLCSLDHTTLERFGMVCRKARVLSLDFAIWR